MKDICEHLRAPRSTYYRWKNKKEGVIDKDKRDQGSVYTSYDYQDKVKKRELP